MGAVALDAGSLHDARLGVADDAPPVEFGELMDRPLTLAPAQTTQRLALELISRAAVRSPGEGIVAVLAHLDAGPTGQAQLLADVVQERGRDAERHLARRGRDRLVDGEARLLHALDVPAILPGGLLEQLRLLRGAIQGVGADQAGGQQ